MKLTGDNTISYICCVSAYSEEVGEGGCGAQDLQKVSCTGVAIANVA